MTSPRQAMRASGLLGVVLVGWFLGALGLSLSGALERATEESKLSLALLFVLPIAVFAGAYGIGSSNQVSRWLPGLVLAQTGRSFGAVWLVLWLLGALPAAFALPAGIGDLAVGVTAPLVYRAVLPRLQERLGVFLLWNAAGILDLVVVVLAVGILQGPETDLADAGTTSTLMAQFPWSLVSTFLAPLFIVMHIVAATSAYRKSHFAPPE